MESNEYQIASEKNYVFHLTLIYHHKNLHLYCNWVYIKRVPAATFISTNSLDVDKFIEDLACAPWNTMDTFDTLNDKYHFGKLYLTPLLNIICPLKQWFAHLE